MAFLFKLVTSGRDANTQLGVFLCSSKLETLFNLLTPTGGTRASVPGYVCYGDNHLSTLPPKHAAANQVVIVVIEYRKRDLFALHNKVKILVRQLLRRQQQRHADQNVASEAVSCLTTVLCSLTGTATTTRAVTTTLVTTTTAPTTTLSTTTVSTIPSGTAASTTPSSTTAPTTTPSSTTAST